MLTHLQLGDQAQATTIYREAQAKDGKYAAWSQAFWDTYQVQHQFEASCEAARVVAHDVGLPGFNYASNPLGAAGAICPVGEIWQDQ